MGRLTFQSLYDAVQALDTSGPVVRTVSLPTPSATLRPGSTGPAVLRLNRLLLFMSQWIPEINFPASDTPANSFDLELETAVRSAQRYFGLTETGVVTAADWETFRHRCRGASGREPRRRQPRAGRYLARRGAGAGQCRARRAAGAAVAQRDCLRRPER